MGMRIHIEISKIKKWTQTYVRCWEWSVCVCVYVCLVSILCVIGLLGQVADPSLLGLPDSDSNNVEKKTYKLKIIKE